MIVMIAAIGVSVFWSYSVEYTGTLVGEVICPFYGFLCCTLILWMEYGVLNENSMKHEQEMMEQLLRMADSQQADERIVILQIKHHNKMVLIHLENRYSTMPEFVNGLPVSYCPYKIKNKKTTFTGYRIKTTNYRSLRSWSFLFGIIPIKLSLKNKWEG